MPAVVVSKNMDERRRKNSLGMSAVVVSKNINKRRRENTLGIYRNVSPC